VSVEGPQSDLQALVDTPYDAILKQVTRSHRLFSVHWELTYRCNEKCTHCYLDVLAPGAVAPGELTTEESLSIIDQIAEAGALNLTLSGGEILLRSDFFEIAAYARAKRLLLRLFTNGIMIRPAIADRIAALHPYAVEISVYSARPEVHDGITRMARSWELSRRALRLLHERGVRTVMKTPIMGENVHEIDALRALADDLGATFRYDITITPKNTGAPDPLKHRISYRDLVEFMRRQIEPDLWTRRNVTQDQPTCGIGQKAIQIDPYGNVYPCIETRFKLGNLRQQSLFEIWQESPLWQELGRLTLSELPVCRICELRNLCVRCHGLALKEDGDLFGPALTNCREALARRQALIDIGAIPADFPIPAHLAQALEEWTGQESDAAQYGNDFIPLSDLMVRKRNLFVNSGER
jgi:radical SAM protein with 4Fe4S-binding SPASM domain